MNNDNDEEKYYCISINSLNDTKLITSKQIHGVCTCIILELYRTIKV